MTDRRYTDDEMAEIFRRATESETSVPMREPGESGFSLQELQDIGREAGIADESVALAARSLDHREPTRTVRVLGLPLGVANSVELDRYLTDVEWDALVVAARDTFHANGRLRVDGTFRQWTNGNLQVLLEPGDAGHRLTLRTRNANLQAQVLGGSAALAFGGLMLFGSVFGPATTAQGLLTGGSMIALAGAAFLAMALVRLPIWARRRHEQFRALIERAQR
ncbi:MAG: hypothetical protein ABIR59_08950 [Gemmatimonadales bacterium]